MDTMEALRHQQMEFFLLHSLAVDELRLLKGSRRVTPAHRSHAHTVNQRTALIGRMFRSLLVKVFPPPRFTVHKSRFHLQKFEIQLASGDVDLLLLAADHAVWQSLLPEPGEIGLLSYSGHGHLDILVVARRASRSRWHVSRWEPGDLGIGRHCPAAKAAIAWRRRFDAAIMAASEVAEEMVGPPWPPPANRVQEQLEAALRAATTAGGP